MVGPFHNVVLFADLHYDALILRTANSEVPISLFLGEVSFVFLSVSAKLLLSHKV